MLKDRGTERLFVGLLELEGAEVEAFVVVVVIHR
jgi:hypothetical protein